MGRCTPVDEAGCFDYVSWLISARKRGLFNDCSMGIRPKFGRWVTQTWSKHQPLLTTQTQVSRSHGNEINFLANASVTTKECEGSSSEHPAEQHLLISSEHSPGLLPKMLGQVLLIFAKLCLWLLKKFPDQQKLSNDLMLKKKNRNLSLPNIQFWVLV